MPTLGSFKRDTSSVRLQVAPSKMYWPLSGVTPEGTLEEALPDGPADDLPVSDIRENESPE